MKLTNLSRIAASIRFCNVNNSFFYHLLLTYLVLNFNENCASKTKNNAALVAISPTILYHNC